MDRTRFLRPLPRCRELPIYFISGNYCVHIGDADSEMFTPVVYTPTLKALELYQ